MKAINHTRGHLQRLCMCHAVEQQMCLTDTNYTLSADAGQVFLPDVPCRTQNCGSLPDGSESVAQSPRPQRI